MTRIGLLLIIFSLLSFPLFSQTVSIPDTSFLYALIAEGVDSDSDSLISNTEAEAIDSLSIPSHNISDLTGIEAFVNLITLDCSYNSLTSVDISNNIALTDLDLGFNELSSIDVSNNTALTDLDLTFNELSTIDLSNNTALTHLDLGYNELSTIDVSNNTLLWWFTCYNNNLTSLDISFNPALAGLYLKDNLLSSLDVSSNTALQYLRIGRNQFTRLDLTNNTSLKAISIDEMPSLECVRVWELPFPPEGVEVDTTFSPNVVFTTDYCPGVGVEDYIQTGLSIYPNPTSSILTIEIERSDHYSIYITTLSGQMVISTEMEGSTHQIELSSFQEGVYFITIRSKEFVITKKIIKL